MACCRQLHVSELTNLSGHSNSASVLDDMSWLPSNCLSSGNICFSDDLLDLIDLSQKTLIAVCAGGRGQVLPPSRSATPSGIYIDNICVLRRCIIACVTALVYERYYSRRQGEFTCKFLVFLFLCRCSFYNAPILRERKQPTPTNKKIDYVTFSYRLKICLVSRCWTSSFELSYIEFKTT